MEIKSHLIEENAKLIYDNEELNEWQDHVQVLGLTRQAALMQPDKSPIPFPATTEAEESILGAILDRHTDYKEFDKEVIPLRVLSLIALCEKEKYFDKIEIWHSTRTKDPIVVGKKYSTETDRQEKRNWNMDVFKIAEWGPKLKSLAELFPAWIEYETAKLKDSYDWNVRQFNEKVERFRFQISAEQPVKKVR